MDKTIIKQLFKINKTPFPWQKAINAGICAGFPVIVGVLVNQIHLGLLAGIGSFSYLYVINEPYAQRAKKIFFAALGISLSVALGTLLAPYPILIILMVGFIGGIAIFIFGVLKIQGPSSMFFVLSFLVSTGMPINQSEVFIRFSVVFMGGLFSWLMSMKGYFLNPHGPEIKVIKKLYLTLADFSEAIGNKNINDIRNRTVNALKEAEEILLTGYILWKNSFLFNRLSLLNEEANKLFLEMLELHVNKNKKLPKEFSDMIRQLSMAIEPKDGEKIKLEVPHNNLDEDYEKFLRIIYDTEAIINLPLTYIGRGIKISKTSLMRKFKRACNKDSIVFINAVRYGVVLSISAIIAFSFHFSRPYWIPLSCAAVMSGSTVISTFHKSIQRSFGTIIGLIIAIIILKIQPEGFMIAIINMLLTALTELFIVKNYAIAVMFITPNALLIAEASTQIHNVTYFATARITDILVGSAIGLIGTYIIGHRSASSRLPDLIVKLIHSQKKLLLLLSTNNKESNRDKIKDMKEKMGVDLMNLKVAYNTALGEIPRNKEMLEMMWPVFFSLEHISYLLAQYCTTKGYLSLSDQELAQLVLVLEKIAISIEQRIDIKPKKVSSIEEISQVCEEINAVQEALIMKSGY
ncbi:FUSC family protein [Clostridium perfringens]|nr:FUSC family protein [Clostridium perfringens]